MQGQRILIVEDDKQIREMLQETLRQEGYETSTAADGELALEQFRKHPAQVVVTDILMPNKEGLQLIKELRKEAPHVGVIAVSGGAPRLQPGCNLELATLFGADATFQKPLDIDALLEAVKKLVGGA